MDARCRLNRATKGQGPSRIALDLEKKGIDPEMVGNALKVSEINWQELALKKGLVLVQKRNQLKIRKTTSGSQKAVYIKG